MYGGTSFSSVPVSYQAAHASWAFTGAFTDASQYKAAGVHTMVYTNFWRCYTSDSPSICYTELKPGGKYASAESMTSSCGSTPAYDSTYGGGYQTDPRTSSAVPLAEDRIKVDPYGASQDIDAIMADDTGIVGGLQGGVCNYSLSSWLSAVNSVHTTVARDLQIQMFPNALCGWIIGGTPVNLAAVTTPSAVLGAMCEGAFASVNGVTTGSTWVNEENSAVAVQQNGKIFWALPTSSASAASAQSLRTYAYASFLLTFDPTHSMYQTVLSTPSKFSVMPETGFVPMDPVTTSGTDVTAYALPGGGYERQWSDCYYNGSFLGSGCAAIVNPTTSTITVPAGYSHSVVLSGSGVYDGGTLSFNGPTVSTLAPGTAAILLP